MDRTVIDRVLKHIGEEPAEPLVREGAAPLRRVGVTAERVGSARAVRGDVVCPPGDRLAPEKWITVCQRG